MKARVQVHRRTPVRNVGAAEPTAISIAKNISSFATRFARRSLAVALPLAWLNTLYYMQGFEKTGELIRMILGIIQGISYFMVIMFVSVIGFALAFFILYDAGPGEFTVAGVDEGVVRDTPWGMQDPLTSLFAGFLLLLGDFNVNEFSASYSRATTMGLFVVFMLFINIVMLNLLIAIMGDIFDR